MMDELWERLDGGGRERLERIREGLKAGGKRIWCHMDLQPQNVAVEREEGWVDRRDEDGDLPEGGEIDPALELGDLEKVAEKLRRVPFEFGGRKYAITGVFDWADARLLPVQFEVVMICRRVVANEAQAKQVWGDAERRMGVELGGWREWMEVERLWRMAMGKDPGPAFIN